MKLPVVAPERPEPKRIRAPLTAEQQEQLRRIAAQIEAIRLKNLARSARAVFEKHGYPEPPEYAQLEALCEDDE